MIKSCNNSEWYKNKLNKIYEVDVETKGGFFVKDGKKTGFEIPEKEIMLDISNGVKPKDKERS
jgi:hypothetical protein